MKGYMSTQEAMKVLGVSKGRISQLIKAGELEAEMFGGAWAISEESVKARLESNPGPGNPNFGPGYSRWSKE